MTRRLSTGVDVLDRKLNGGIPVGNVVALSAPPVSQSELFMYELASMRETLYITTEREVTAIEDILASTGVQTGGVEVVRIEAGDSAAAIEDSVAELPSESNVIIDPVRQLERPDTADYRSVLNTVRARTRATDSVALLHCLDGRAVPPARDLTEYMADLVFDISTVQAGDSLETHLAVPKFRGGQALDEVIKLDLSAGVTIDVSRKIA